MDKISYKVFIDHLKPTIEEEISQVGGYWPVNVAISVVGQELGLAVDALMAEEDEKAAEYLSYALWVLTCISNQYNSDLGVIAQRFWGEETNKDNTARDLVLMSFSGYSKVQRIVNRYENNIFGDQEQSQPIGVSIVKTHRAIVDAIAFLGFDLNTQVEKRVHLVRSFRGTPQVPEYPRFDPTTSPSLSAFWNVANQTACPFAKSAKVWATEPWAKSVNAVDFVGKSKKLFGKFARACQPEGFDGIVVEAKGIDSIDELQARTKELLTALGPYSQRNPMAQPISRKEWRFTLFNIDVFLTIFSSIYDVNHPRSSRSPDSTVFFFQPQISFKAKAAKEKNNIRSRFVAIGQDYSPFLKRVRCEGHKYVKPFNLAEDEPLEWWDSPE